MDLEISIILFKKIIKSILKGRKINVIIITIKKYG